MVHLCHCSCLFSWCLWWSSVCSPSGHMWVDFPDFLCWYKGDMAYWISDSWGHAKFMMASSLFCWRKGRSWDVVFRLMLNWMVGGKGCDEVVFWGFGCVTVAGLANGELRQSPHSALTPMAGGCCCREGLEVSFRCTFFSLLIWVTWGDSQINSFEDNVLSLMKNVRAIKQHWWIDL